MATCELVAATTADGTSTLYRPDIDEHYHSTAGAVTESRHVYIDMALRHRASGAFDIHQNGIGAPLGVSGRTDKPTSASPNTDGTIREGNALRVLEIGLGTALNATLTAQTGIPVQYTAIEKYPLSSGQTAALTFGEGVDRQLMAAILDAPGGVDAAISDTFTLHKIYGDFHATAFDGEFDVIYMDAFAPEKQPDLWSDEVLARLAGLLAPGGVLTTYCAKGCIRRSFESLGLRAERLPGPPGGKREILRVSKPDPRP